MNYKDDINTQLQNLNTTASEKLDTRIHAAINKSLAQAEQPDTWRIIMKSNSTKFAAVFAVMIIVAITVIHFSGGKIDFVNPAFADVMENIYKAKNVTYMQKMITSRGEFTTRDIATDTGLLRTEMSFDRILLSDHANGIQMTLYPTQKKCYITQIKRRKITARPFTWLEWIQKMHHKAAEYSHSEVLDGNNTDVFLIEAPFEKTTIWVDSQTDLPVKIVMEMFKNTEVEGGLPKLALKKSDFGGSPNVSSFQGFYGARGSGLGFSEESTLIMTDFVWDSELDPSLFSFEPHDDWKVVKRERKEPEIKKEDLIKALSFWIEMNDGKFPDEINDLMNPALLNPMLIKKYNTGGDPDKQYEQAQLQAEIVLSGLFFTQNKLVNNYWHYAGSGITFGDTDTPIAWWQNEEDNTWTVIYADLSFNEAAEDPPVE